jgi:hypothetical protein
VANGAGDRSGRPRLIACLAFQLDSDASRSIPWPFPEPSGLALLTACHNSASGHTVLTKDLVEGSPVQSTGLDIIPVEPPDCHFCPDFRGFEIALHVLLRQRNQFPTASARLPQFSENPPSLRSRTWIVDFWRAFPARERLLSPHLIQVADERFDLRNFAP